MSPHMHLYLTRFVFSLNVKYNLSIIKAQGDGCKKLSRQKVITQTPAPTIIGLRTHD